MAESYTTKTLLTIAREGLRDIGYHNDLLREEYEFADILAQNQSRKIELAAFAQEPPSYLSSCIGITFPLQQGPEEIAGYRALGAPQILALHPENEKILRWKIHAENQPELLESVELPYLRNFILQHKDDWKPEEVLRAKSIRFTGVPVQLDFFDVGLIPAIEEVVHTKLDTLLRDVLAICKSVYQEHHDAEPDPDALYRLIFRFIAAKLLGDRQHSDKWLNSNAQEVLAEIERFYFQHAPSQGVLNDIHTQNAAWNKIRSAFSFQNLSVEALAYIYENTLVNPVTRKKLGIHATAYPVAEYIVQQLPIQALPDEERRVFEPFAGHAPFLIAALGRLRTLLTTDMPVEKRHDYFISMLTGMEYEPFACEVAGYSLILADYPNPNGWRIEKADVFTSPKLSNYLKRATIVLSNPPFEKFTKEERKKYPALKSVNKAVEALNRVLENPPKMLGFVLPLTFIDGQMYVEVRRKIARVYKNLSFVVLPDNAFNYSDVETVLLIAYNEQTIEPTWKFAQVDRKDYKRFLSTGKTTWQVLASADFIAHQIDNPTFWYTPLHSIWDALASLPRLNSVVDIHRGIEYKSFKANKSNLVSALPREGFVKGIGLTTEGFELYEPRYFSYFNMDSKHMRRKSYKHPWEKPKVIVNAVRIKSDRWVMAGIVDEQGLVCYQNFHGLWPTAHLPIEVIAALVNSPIANAFLSTHRSAWHNRKDTIEQIPVPELRPSQIRRIVSLVREYMSYRKQWDTPPEQTTQLESRCRGILKHIDAEILAAYNLPMHLEAELLKYFDGYERPGPFSPAQLHASPTKRRYTSIMRVEDVKQEDGNEVVEVALMNWNPHQTVRFPVALVPENIRPHLERDVLLVAEVNVGAKKAKDLSFEAIRLAPEMDPDDGLA